MQTTKQILAIRNAIQYACNDQANICIVEWKFGRVTNSFWKKVKVSACPVFLVVLVSRTVNPFSKIFAPTVYGQLICTSGIKKNPPNKNPVINQKLTLQDLRQFKQMRDRRIMYNEG